MGFGIRDSVEPVRRSIILENLFNKTISIDAFNYLYQFLHAFKGRDNKLLKNYSGEVTSHLSGLFYRCNSLIEANIRPIFCYDGLEKEHKLRWDDKPKDIRLTKEMIISSKELLDCMGISHIQSPGEGEAQCVYLAQNDDVWGISSQDYDVMLFGGQRFIRNLSVSKSKVVKGVKVAVNIEFILLSKFLEYHKITREQLIDMSILTGNDFFSGIQGIGEKKGLKMIQEKKSIENITNIEFKLKGKDKNITYIKDEFIDITNKIRKIFLDPNVKKDYNIKKKKLDYDKLKEFMVEKNNFNEQRITTIINKLRSNSVNMKQKSIMDYNRKYKKMF